MKVPPRNDRRRDLDAESRENPTVRRWEHESKLLVDDDDLFFGKKKKKGNLEETLDSILPVILMTSEYSQIGVSKHIHRAVHSTPVDGSPPNSARPSMLP